MTREQAKELLPIIQAFAEGKTIQIKQEGDWFDVGKNTEVYFSESPSDYRIKPESEYRPFKSQEECWGEMHKHPDFGWVKDKEKLSYYPIQEVSDTNHYRNLLNDYEFTDGTPFGIKEG